MAKINSQNIKRVDKQRNTVHEEAYATYTSFELEGEKFVQIDTYGRPGRDNPEKISQSIQIDKITAKYLVDLLTREFELN